MGKKKDLTGNRFGRLLVIKEVGQDKYYYFVWECLCDCGNYTRTTSKRLINGDTKSCGCLNLEAIKKSNTTHGKKNTSEYRSWCGMKARCYNINNHKYYRYGARGITVCERWLKSFENFFEDMGEKPEKRLTVDRIDNDLGYFKENCRWGTPRQQSGNRSTNHWLEYKGRKMILEDWAIELGTDKSGIRFHLSRGRSFEEVYNYFKSIK